MLHKEAIEPDNTEWTTLIVFGNRNDRSLRFCVDYHKLNMETFTDS